MSLLFSATVEIKGNVDDDKFDEIADAYDDGLRIALETATRQFCDDVFRQHGVRIEPYVDGDHIL